MGAPTLSQCHSWTDTIAAKVALDQVGFFSEYQGQASASLWDAVDASGDPVVEDALMTAALAVDRQSLPENVQTYLRQITGRPAYLDFVRAFDTLVRSTAGGGYASFRAYLADKAVTLHHLAGEAVRTALGETAFTASSVVLGVAPPMYGVLTADRVYTGADGALAEDTTDAASATTADVALFGTNGFACYLGCKRPFQAACFALSTLSSASITPTFQYWNGSAWATLTVVDNTSGMQQSDIITWTPPADWGTGYKDGGGTAFAALERLYYIRIARSNASGITPPVGTCITLVPKVIPTVAGGSLHAAIQQPPLAICRITGASTQTVTQPATIDYTRFAEPIGTGNKLRLRALTAIASNLTPTIKYTLSTGATTGSVAQSAWTAPAALGTAVVALTSTDALRAVLTTSTVSTSATTGVYVVELVEIRTPAI